VDPEAELEQLRARVSQLEQHLERLMGRLPAAPTDSPTVSLTGGDGFSRRRMLRNGLSLSAAAVAGVGMLDAAGSAAAAADGDPVTVAATTSPTAATSAPTRILNPSVSVHAPVLFRVDNTTDRVLALPGNTSAALVATFAGSDAQPTGQSAILGLAELGTGVDGRSDGFVGVAGTSVFGTGVHGSSSSGTGVQATSTDGPAISATSTSGRGILASSTSGEGIRGTSADNIGVVGDCLDGFGVVGNSGNGTGLGGSGRTGVLAVGADVGIGSTSDSGIAVRATSTTGTGLQAVSSAGIAVSATSTTDVGARLQGGSAAVRLVPQPASGPPGSGEHHRGEMLVDSRGRLWLCTTTGTPGTWRKVALV
jgi:hypothetical protein